MEPTTSPSTTANNQRLIVMLHAWTLKPESLMHVVKVIQEELPGSEVFVPPLALGRWSMANPCDIAKKVGEQIDEKVKTALIARKPYDDIILAGHSMGALIVRQVYLDSIRVAEAGGGLLEENNHWVRRVSRIILLAGMNRGWTISHEMGPVKALITTLGTMIGETIRNFTGKSLTVLTIRRGAQFITQLRLDWLQMEKQLKDQGLQASLTIQLLGSVDDVVSPEDNVDLESGRNFVYLDVPRSGHATVVDMDKTEAGLERRNVFRRALLEREDELRKTMLAPVDDPFLMQKTTARGGGLHEKTVGLENTGTPAASYEVDHVIFVIHGIRDKGYWTHKIAREVQRFGNKPPRIYASQTSTYGYFAMFPFLLPSRRQNKVEWLMDRYVEAKARYPDAKFSYVGHSNGTYLLAKALEEYPGCKFDNVVFAGSVVRRDYNWSSMLEANKVKAVLNYVATADWVVAWFPGALELLRMQDLGSAGHNGFDQMKQLNATGPLQEVRCVPGGHGAAIDERMWKDIAHFIIHGKRAEPPAQKLEHHRHWLVVLLGWVAPAIWFTILGLLISISIGIWNCNSHPEWERTLGITFLWWVVWKILTRV